MATLYFPKQNLAVHMEHVNLIGQQRALIFKEVEAYHFPEIRNTSRKILKVRNIVGKPFLQLTLKFPTRNNTSDEIKLDFLIDRGQRDYWNAFKGLQNQFIRKFRLFFKGGNRKRLSFSKTHILWKGLKTTETSFGYFVSSTTTYSSSISFEEVYDCRGTARGVKPTEKLFKMKNAARLFIEYLKWLKQNKYYEKYSK